MNVQGMNGNKNVLFSKSTLFYSVFGEKIPLGDGKTFKVSGVMEPSWQP
jgi:hypothetical protein